MNQYQITVTETETINPEVIKLICSKPEGFIFTSGQAVKLSISNTIKSEDDFGAFTITSTPEENQLEFIIKIYPSRNGFTDKAKSLNTGDTLFMSSAYGYMTYDKSGMFIAAGSGITPFISIFKNLSKKGILKGNKLIYANDNQKDIIFEKQLKEWFGSDFISILSQQKTQNHYYGLIDYNFLNNAIEDYTQNFYLCGPPAMMDTIAENLKKMGVSESQIVK